MKIPIYILMYFVVLGISCVNAQDKNHPFLTDKFIFGVGVYFPTKTLDIGVKGSIQTPNGSNNLDFGESVGLNDSQATLSLNLEWRFSKNWKLSSQYFSIDNTEKATLKDDVQWGDYEFRKGSFVKAGFNLDMYRIFIGRVISRGQNHELGGGLGVHLMDIGAFIQGKAYINDQEFKDHLEAVNVIAPLPNLGFWYFVAPLPKFLISANVDWFGITIGEYSGSLWHVSPGLSYQLLNNLGIHASYRFFRVSARVDKPDWDGRFSFTFNGPHIGLTANF